MISAKFALCNEAFSVDEEKTFAKDLFKWHSSHRAVANQPSPKVIHIFKPSLNALLSLVRSQSWMVLCHIPVGDTAYTHKYYH